MKVDTDSSVLYAVMSNQTFVTSHQSSSPPGYLFSMMGCWAAVSGVLGFTTNLLAIGTFLTVKKVKTKRFGACLQFKKSESLPHYSLFHSWGLHSTGCWSTSQPQSSSSPSLATLSSPTTHSIIHGCSPRPPVKPVLLEWRFSVELFISSYINHW